jgi:Protein of unknown function (DUF3800)
LPGAIAPGAFAVLTAYMDESGTHDAEGREPGSEVAAIAGYVASYKQWVRFQRGWRRVLNKFGVEIYHAKDCAHRKGEFKGWSDDKRRNFYIALTEVINEAGLRGLGGLVPLGAYNTVLPDWARAEIRHPYYFCFAVMMRTLRKYRDAFSLREPIEFIFDRKKGYQGALTEMFEKLRDESPNHRGYLGEIYFRSKDSLTPLQAADHLAYEVRRYAADQLVGSSRPTRGTMEALMKRRRLMVGYYDEEDLKRHVDTRLMHLGVRPSV